MCVLTPIALKEVDSIPPPAYNDDPPPPLPATAVDMRCTQDPPPSMYVHTLIMFSIYLQGYLVKLQEIFTVNI